MVTVETPTEQVPHRTVAGRISSTGENRTEATAVQQRRSKMCTRRAGRQEGRTHTADLNRGSSACYADGQTRLVHPRHIVACISTSIIRVAHSSTIMPFADCRWGRQKVHREPVWVNGEEFVLYLQLQVHGLLDSCGSCSSFRGANETPNYIKSLVSGM